MAIDAKKMQAFTKQGPKGGGGGGPPPNKGAEGGGHEEPDDEQAEGGGEEPKYDKLLALLEQHGQDIEACIEELDPEQLTNFGEELSSADKEILREGFDDLEQAVVDEGKHVLAGIDEGEAEKLGEHLESEGAVKDGHVVGAWLFRVGQMLDEAPESGADDAAEDEADSGADEGDEGEPDEASAD